LSGEYIELYKRNTLSRETKSGPKQRAVALYYYYSGQIMDQSIAKKIAAEYGWKKEFSGKSLCDDYNKYCDTTNRVGSEGNAKGNKTKIRDIQTAIQLLDQNGFPTDKANDELKTFLSRVEKGSYR